MDAGRFKPILKSLGERLKDPIQLRFILAVIVLAAWYFGVYATLNVSLEQTVKERTTVVSHTALAREIQGLRGQVARYQPRLPAGADANEWVEYILKGVREFPVRLLKLEPMGTKKHGPFAVIVLRIDLLGQYADLVKLLAWIESNPRLLRVDSIGTDPTRANETGVTLKLTVLGVMS